MQQKNPRRSPRLLLCLMILSLCTACQSYKTDSKRLVIINIRGTSFESIRSHVKNHSDGFFAELMENGEVKELMPVNNAVTAVNLAAFETGLKPHENGIIGHQFGQWNGDDFQSVSGFAKPYEVPSFLELADEAGKNVINLGSLRLHGGTENHQQLVSIAQGRALSNPRIMLLDEASETVRLARGQKFYVRRTGSPGDYSYVLDVDERSDNGTMGSIPKDDWLNVDLIHFDSIKSATRLKLMEGKDGRDRLFIRSAFAGRGYPATQLNQIEEEVGRSQGWPSMGMYFSGVIGEEIIKEEIDREVAYLGEIFTNQLHKDYDLIVMDYPRIDRYGHIFSIDLNQGHSQEAFNAMEQDLEQFTRQAREKGYRVLIQSGHGFSPIHTEINLQRALMTFLGQNSNEVQGVPGKVSSYLYFHPGFSPELQKGLLTDIKEWRDDRTGSKIVEQVWSKEDMKSRGMVHADAGDLYILLKPGYVFSAEGSEQAPLFKAPNFKGDHGYDILYPESRGVLMHPGYLPEPALNSITDLAHYVLAYLEVSPEKETN